MHSYKLCTNPLSSINYNTSAGVNFPFESEIIPSMYLNKGKGWNLSNSHNISLIIAISDSSVAKYKKYSHNLFTVYGVNCTINRQILNYY